MIRVLFFASLREQLACDELHLEVPAGALTVESLISLITSEKGDSWSQALGQENLISAVNQQIVAVDTAVADGDEVAFFPPVTGG